MYKRQAALDAGRQVKATIDFLPGFRDNEALWQELVEEKCTSCRQRSMEVLFGGLVNKKIIQTAVKLCGLSMGDRAERKNLPAIRKVFALLRRDVYKRQSLYMKNSRFCMNIKTIPTGKRRICFFHWDINATY